MAAKKMLTVILWFLLIMILAVQFHPYLIRNYFKVTNPDSPAFDPDQFQFVDYKTDKDLAAALYKTIPLGTPKATVEERLLERNNTEKFTRDHMPNFNGFCRNPAFSVIRVGACMHIVGVYYNENQEVQQVKVHGLKLFSETSVTAMEGKG